MESLARGRGGGAPVKYKKKTGLRWYRYVFDSPVRGIRRLRVWMRLVCDLGMNGTIGRGFLQNRHDIISVLELASSFIFAETGVDRHKMRKLLRQEHWTYRPA